MLLPAFSLAQPEALLNTTSSEPTAVELDWAKYLAGFDSTSSYLDKDIIKSVKTANLPTFTDIKELFDTAGSMQIPVQYIAIYRQDVGVCSLFIGTGNPDLAGVGVCVNFYLSSDLAEVSR